MKSRITEELKTEFHPVVLLKSNEKPEGARQAKPDTYYCIMSMFVQATKNGRTIVFDRKTYGCPGARAGLGFGTDYDKVMGGYPTFSAFFSKGLEDAEDKEAYKGFADKMNPHVRNKLIEGERFHANREKALKWISKELPVYDFPEKYRILKPLAELDEGEIPESAIFTVNPLLLTALITLAGSIRSGINSMVNSPRSSMPNAGCLCFCRGGKRRSKRGAWSARSGGTGECTQNPT